jgi:tetratricopeptide (TPR) repeat protein
MGNSNQSVKDIKFKSNLEYDFTNDGKNYKLVIEPNDTFISFTLTSQQDSQIISTSKTIDELKKFKLFKTVDSTLSVQEAIEKSFKDKSVLIKVTQERAILAFLLNSNSQLVSAFLILGNYEEEHSEEHYRCLEELIKGLYKERRYNELLAILDVDCLIDKLDKKLSYYKGIALFNIKLFLAARKALSRVDTSYLDTEDYLAKIDNKLKSECTELMKKGLALLHKGKYDKALECFEKAIQICPDNDIQYIKKGIAFYGLKKYEEAVQSLNKAIQLNPGNQAIYTVKALALIELGIYSDALSLLEGALLHDPKNVKLFMEKCRALLSMGKYSEAIDCYDKAINLTPKDPILYSHKGKVLFELKRYNDAMKCYEKVIELNPKSSDDLCFIGYCMIELRKEDDAITFFDKAIRVDKKHINTYYYKGTILFGRGQYEEAIALYDQAIAHCKIATPIDPFFKIIGLEKTSALVVLNRGDAALEVCNDLLKVISNDASIYHVKGELLCHVLHRIDEGIQCFDKAIKIDPMFVDAYNCKGVALRKLDRYDEAIKCFAKVIELDKDCVEGYVNMGFTLSKLKRKEEAKSWYFKAINLDPNSELAKKKLRKLQ